MWRVVCEKVVCERVVCERLWVKELCVKDCERKSCVWKIVCDKVVCERVVYDKVACDKAVCERLCLCVCVTKLCVKDCVWPSCVWKIVCDESCIKLCVTKLSVTKLCVTKLCVTKLCVTKLCVTKMCVREKLHVSEMCVKDCVWQSCGWQSCVWEMCVKKLCMTEIACDKIVCVTKLCVPKLWVTKLCVREMCEKVVCERVVFDKVVCDKVACEREREIERGRERCERLCVTKLCVTKSYLREMDSLAAWMSPSATPATQSAAATPRDQGTPSALLWPSAISATPKMRGTSCISFYLGSICRSARAHVYDSCKRHVLKCFDTFWHVFASGSMCTIGSCIMLHLYRLSWRGRWYSSRWMATWTCDRTGSNQSAGLEFGAHRCIARRQEVLELWQNLRMNSSTTYRILTESTPRNLGWRIWTDLYTAQGLPRTGSNRQKNIKTILWYFMICGYHGCVPCFFPKNIVNVNVHEAAFVMKQHNDSLRNRLVTTLNLLC